jgi:hypothetical protein
MRANAVLNERLRLAHKLRRKKHHTSRPVSNLSILRPRDIDERLGSGMHDIEEFEDRRAVVGDGRLTVGSDDELVHAAGTEGRGDGLGDGEAGGDVGEELGGSYEGERERKKGWVSQLNVDGFLNASLVVVTLSSSCSSSPSRFGGTAVAAPF